MKRLLLIVPPATVVAAAIAAGVAFAYWSTGGSGTGSGSTSSLQAVTVVAATGTPATPLLPGGSGDVVLSVRNPNPYDVTLAAVSLNGSITPDSNHSTCTASGVTFSNQTGLSNDIPGNGATTAVDLPGAAAMSAASQSACQGATFSIQVAITVHKG